MGKSMVTQQLDELIARQAQICSDLQDEIGRVLVGQEHMLSRLLIGLLTGGVWGSAQPLYHRRLPAATTRG